MYGAEGVCRVAAVGPLSMRDAQDGVNYYTLSPLYRSGTIYVPVDAALHTRPVMSREDAQRLIAHIPDVAPKLCESNNPRLLNEHYQALLKSDDCVDRVRLIRAVYAKGRAAAKKGKRLGQVDERSMKRAEDILQGLHLQRSQWLAGKLNKYPERRAGCGAEYSCGRRKGET